MATPPPESYTAQGLRQQGWKAAHTLAAVARAVPDAADVSAEAASTPGASFSGRSSLSNAAAGSDAAPAANGAAEDKADAAGASLSADAAGAGEAVGPPEGAAPGSPEKAAPGSPEKVAPGSPEKVAPGSPEKAAPGSPEKVAPGSPEKVAPGSPEKAAPGSPEKVAPGSPEKVAPGSPEKVAPGSPEKGPRVWARFLVDTCPMFLVLDMQHLLGLGDDSLVPATLACVMGLVRQQMLLAHGGVDVLRFYPQVEPQGKGQAVGAQEQRKDRCWCWSLF